MRLGQRSSSHTPITYNGRCFINATPHHSFDISWISAVIPILANCEFPKKLGG